MDQYDFLIELLQKLAKVPSTKANAAKIKNLRMSHIAAMRDFKKHSAHLKQTSKPQA